MAEPRFRSHIEAVLRDTEETSDSMDAWVGPTTESRVEEIPVDLIGEPEWRPVEDDATSGYRALKASIRASGILQPLLLRSVDERYQVVSGSRRLRAARETGQTTVPALVRQLSDLEALLGGWDAILRSGVTDAERRALAARCVAAGMPEGDAEALVTALPSRAGPEAATPPVPAMDAAVVEVEAVVEAAAVAEVEIAPPAIAPAAEPEPAAIAPASEPEPEYDGWPAAAVPEIGLAPTSPPPRLPLDPVRFELGPLPPLHAAAAEPAETSEAQPRAAESEAPPPATEEAEDRPVPAERSAERAELETIGGEAAAPRRPAPGGPRVIPITLPSPSAPTHGGPGTGDQPATPVAAPEQPAASGSPVAPTVLGPGQSRPAAPRPVAETVPALPAPAPRRPHLGGVPMVLADPRTVATAGVAVGVGAACFIIVAVLLGASAGRPLLVAAVVAVIGFLMAIVSLALPRRDGL